MKISCSTRTMIDALLYIGLLAHAWRHLTMCRAPAVAGMEMGYSVELQDSTWFFV